MCYTFTEFITLLFTFLVISFSQYKKSMVCLISFSKFSDVLPAFTCTRAIGNVWSICLGVNILSHLPCLDFIGSIPLLKALRVNFRSSQKRLIL